MQMYESHLNYWIHQVFIPPNMEDQSDALLLAAINSIVEAVYDTQTVTAYFMEWMKSLYLIHQQDVTVPHMAQKGYKAL